jgi:hypothetical protein
MSLKHPNAALVRDFWAFMTRRFRTRAVVKADAVEMRAIGAALDAMGVADKRDFMNRFATTVGRRIYLPFTPGEDTSTWDLAEQLNTCAHEHQHVVQYDRDGALRYGYRYLRNDAARAQYEAEARTTELEIHFWRFGSIPRLELAIQGLASYSLGKSDIAAALATLRSNAEAVKRGAVLTEAGRVAIDWLNDHAPELRRVGQA